MIKGEGGEGIESYVDLKPKVLEAKIFTPDATHPNGWGTVLICGMNLGGKQISVVDPAFSGGSKSFSSSYVALDVTDPSRPPALLWEKTYDGLAVSCVRAPIAAWASAAFPRAWRADAIGGIFRKLMFEMP